MMLSLVTREWLVVARRHVVPVVAAVYAGVLAAVTIVWGLRFEALTGSGFYDVFRAVEIGVLTIVMPWTVVRCAASDRNGDMTLLSSLTAARPSSIVIAKVVSCGVTLALVAAAAAPAAIVAGQLAAVPIAIVVRDFASSLALVFLAAAVTTAWMFVAADAIAAWIGGSVATAVVAAAARELAHVRGAQDALAVGVAVIALAAAAFWSDRTLLYCS